MVRAPSTTWALVSTYPSLAKITPDPVALPVSDRASIFTTAGSTAPSTCCSWSPAAVAAPAAWFPVVAWLPVAPVAVVPPSRSGFRLATTPPPPPAR